jgi:hypothetical protein
VKTEEMIDEGGRRVFTLERTKAVNQASSIGVGRTWFTKPFSLQKPLPIGNDLPSINQWKPVKIGRFDQFKLISIRIGLPAEKPVKNQRKTAVNR